MQMQRRWVEMLVLCSCLVVVVQVSLVLGSSSSAIRTGYPRANRGFKSQGLSTARGFGKRDPSIGGQQSSMETLSSLYDSRSSYPVSWLVEELQSNPESARLIVEKLVNENGDRELTPDELFKRPNY